MARTEEDQFDFLFKVVLIGDCGVGKTCVVTRFKSGNFVERHSSTIGVDFSMKTIMVDGKKVKLQIWDTAGQERFRTITQSYYRSAHGVIIVYDVTKRSSFTSVRRWMDEVRRYTTPNVAVVLIGNKCDMADHEIKPEETDALMDSYPEIFAFIETSAKENHKVEEPFLRLAKVLVDNDRAVTSPYYSQTHLSTEPLSSASDPIRIDAGRPVGGGGCCSR
ncbi:ras-related protein Rab-43-like isoform X2 [Amphibalanus amphitrite]|nr:ras-related protein Rab-43-like isoform X2 [Amphibalanus amphitrite]XP_043223246.1 ras-related protein Rab-43-like isoform X2 [Amphibalanus amphitrite]XP_043223247.1 ras-related protein Rab-43-like isoform X2 [Amphibalanus amphitrite]XP_043223248.1 ras-related protein Rab-43-like isoform X2 [Amphibalanus amphitrite]XP_043223249.1 ras-related protein Rab-43-like isoform X2 [Amphibalanus amphitrite]XP_043223250.1 ras-related protein Rab-43-like isoform X2 [Amphibalanus amphitrite]XP_04322325